MVCFAVPQVLSGMSQPFGPVDIYFDVRVDSNSKDPDYASKTLKSFHKILWSKKLPNGQFLELRDHGKSTYLSAEQDFVLHHLSSDTMCNSYGGKKRMSKVLENMEDEVFDFRKSVYTVGNFILFPGKKIDGKWTINQERGVNQKISDRMDLTLECIRLYYLGLDSPLLGVLKRYKTFFDMFVNFEGYVDFFLLNDLVNDRFNSVMFFTEIDKPFLENGLPKSQIEYLIYKANAVKLIQSRNSRIHNWVKQNSNLNSNMNNS